MAEEQLIWIPLKEELDRLRRRVEFDWAFADIAWAAIGFYYCHDLGDGSSPVRHRFKGGWPSKIRSGRTFWGWPSKRGIGPRARYSWIPKNHGRFWSVRQTAKIGSTGA